MASMADCFGSPGMTVKSNAGFATAVSSRSYMRHDPFAPSEHGNIRGRISFTTSDGGRNPFSCFNNMRPQSPTMSLIETLEKHSCIYTDHGATRISRQAAVDRQRETQLQYASYRVTRAQIRSDYRVRPSTSTEQKVSTICFVAPRLDG